jgi:hypothetical protein
MCVARMFLFFTKLWRLGGFVVHRVDDVYAHACAAYAAPDIVVCGSRLQASLKPAQLSRSA